MLRFAPSTSALVNFFATFLWTTTREAAVHR